MARATVIADASWCPHTRAGGWAVWINVNYDDGGHRRLQESGNFKNLPRSSEHAEHMACMIGIWMAVQHGAIDILVQTDCLSIVQTEGRPGQKLAREFLDAQKKYWQGMRLKWKHVKGHTGGQCPNGGDNRRFYVNEWCDKQAKRKMRKQRLKIQKERA